jgi:UDPglucose--hexose-1-phosphate uridylyltransferase
MAEVRRDIVNDTWVIVQTDSSSAERQGANAWLGRPAIRNSESCPFCEGHEALTPPETFSIRTSGTTPNAPGWQVRVVPSHQPILRIEGELKRSGVGIHDMVTGIGANEVIVETPEHGASLSELTDGQISLVLISYRQRIADLYRDQRLRYVMVFKKLDRRADSSGVVHSHSELIALPATPRRIKDELNGARHYYEYKERCIFCDIIQNELDARKRVLLETGRFLVYVPYAGRFPFELTVIPKGHGHAYENAADDELADLGSVMKRTLTALRVALEGPACDYALHTAPNLLPKRGYWQTIRDDFHWHIEIIPRIGAFEGFERESGLHINPVAPERAAEILREKL